MGGSVLEILRGFIGLPPTGYEWLEYGVAVIFVLFLFQFVFDFFRNMAKIFIGR